MHKEKEKEKEKKDRTGARKLLKREIQTMYKTVEQMKREEEEEDRDEWVNRTTPEFRVSIELLFVEYLPEIDGEQELFVDNQCYSLSIQSKVSFSSSNCHEIHVDD